MPLLAQYILKLSICLMVVYLFYAIVLRRMTFYNCNRWYLLGYSLLAFVIPFINISPVLQQSEWQQSGFVQLVPVVDSYTFIDLPGMETAPVYTWQDILLPLLLAGIVLLLVRLLVQYWSYRRLHRSAQLVVNKTVKIYQVDHPITPFSFGNSIFINRRQYGEEELEKIIRHEFVHVTQKHTFDILLAELLCILNWYNPFAWLIRRSIRQNLEFIADNEVLQNGIDKKQYQYLLLRVMGNTQFSFTNQFNIISLKKRIAMMNKIKSAKIQLIKFLFVLPLLATMLLAFRSIAIDNAAAGTVDVQDVLSVLPPAPEDEPGAEIPSPGEAMQKNKPHTTVAAADTQTLPNIIAHLKAPGNPYKHRTDTAPAPLIIIDGVIQPKGTDAMKRVDAGDIESIDVLKDAQAISVYGDKGRNGVILITTKAGASQKMKENKANNFITDRPGHHPSPLYIVDGKEYDKVEFEKDPVAPDNIKSITVLKDSSATAVYGEKGRHGVLLITTKAGARKEVKNDQDSGLIQHMLNCRQPELFIIEGREYSKSDFEKNPINPNAIESVDVLKGSRATDIYGEKGKHGVVIIKLKKEITKSVIHYQYTPEQMKVVLEKAQRDHVLYIGVKNPVKIVIDGVNNNDMVVRVDGTIDVSAEQINIYSISPGHRGPVKIEIFKKGKAGKLTLLNTLEYTAKYLPPPGKLLSMLADNN